MARAGAKPCSMSFHVFMVSRCSFRLFSVCSCVRWLRVVSRARVAKAGAFYTLAWAFPISRAFFCSSWYHGVVAADKA